MNKRFYCCIRHPGIIIMLFLIYSLCIPLNAADTKTLIVRDYSAITSIEGNTALIVKGDNPLYKDTDFDDRNWNRTSIPSSWTGLYPEWTGICWYRIHIVFPDTQPRQAIGVELGIIIATDEAYFNGERIGRSGEMSDIRKSAYDKKRIYEIPAVLIKPSQDNILAVKVQGLFPAYNGIWKGNLRIAPLRELQRRTYFSEVTEMIFVVVYLVFVAYFLLLFFSRTKEKSNLHFALFCLVMSCYFVLRTQLKHHAGIDFYWAKKCEYLLLPLLVMQGLEFIRTYFDHKRSSIIYVYYSMTAASFLIILFTGSYQLWKSVNHYIIQPSWVIGIGILFYILAAESKKRNKDAISMLIGFSLLLIIVINDVMIDRLIYSFYRLDNFGFFFIIVSIAVIINRRFVQIHSQLEDLTMHLEEKVQSRTLELEEFNTRLTNSSRYIFELNDRYINDFKLASKVQMGLIPAAQSNAYWQSAVFFRPSALVSGDFYDMYPLDNETLGVTIADASGHGVASALVTMITKPVFLQQMKNRNDEHLGQVMEAINAELCEEIGDIDNFLSAVIVLLGKNSITISNAGHPPALMRLPDGTVRQFVSSGSYLGVPVLITPYSADSADAPDETLLLLFSDSLIESRNDSNEEFGLLRVLRIMEEKNRDAEELIQDLTTALFAFTGSPALDDDITILAFKKIKSPAL